MAKSPVGIANVYQEAVLPGYVASPQVLVHKEGLAGTGRAQQEHVVVHDEALLQGHFLYVKPQRYQPDTVAHLEHPARNPRLKAIANPQAKRRPQLQGHVFRIGQAALVAWDAGPHLRRSVGHIPHGNETQSGDSRSSHVLIRRENVQVAADGCHLLHGSFLQVFVNLFGVLSVLGVPKAHTLHLTALAVQFAVQILHRLFYTEPVHHVLAWEPVSQLVQIGKRHGRMLRAQFRYPPAGRHFTGQLVQVRKEVTNHPLPAHHHRSGLHLDIGQLVRTFVRKVQVILQNAGTPFRSEDVLIGETSHLQTGHRLKLCGRLQSSSHGARGQHIGRYPQQPGACVPDVFLIGKAEPQQALVVQIFPAVEVPLVSLLQKAGSLLGRVLFPHENILLVHHRVIREQADGTDHRCYN